MHPRSICPRPRNKSCLRCASRSIQAMRDTERYARPLWVEMQTDVWKLTPKQVEVLRLKRHHTSNGITRHVLVRMIYSRLPLVTFLNETMIFNRIEIHQLPKDAVTLPLYK
ncbi:hypothetical protein EVAR_2851_1 [Eumeta japonica]|uniref:Uncharacterized protein n=1 Tax=Eumeta variegata TaxID=151549 RepID=A0A4C1T0Q2_EUMVA|nr:hypothetical protein EVAR_2851_1 [Eumeta japonica]